jgi:hypothetical protein
MMRRPSPSASSARKKAFFFEKKKQKTFMSLRALAMSPRQRAQKFFGSFFQKKNILSLSAQDFGRPLSATFHRPE